MPLVRTGSKARDASLSRPRRFGQAAKASLGPPGSKEDLALQRRRLKRRAAAGAAVELAANMSSIAGSSGPLDGGSKVATDVGAADFSPLGPLDVQGGDESLPSTTSLPSLITPMLPRGSIVFPALLTSELEGIQVWWNFGWMDWIFT